jgi:exosortase A-associated hydrolase 1
MIQALKMADRKDEKEPVRNSQSSWREQPIIFECDGCRLIGIAAVPAKPVETGVVIVVGGPQYRSGSHRQFTLLARHLADEGIASFRFDYRGMGDSEGDMRNFEVVDADIRAAIDAFLKHVPSLSKVILWGLCDAASAALFYGHTDPRVNGLVLLNPWVHSEAGAAHVRLKYYYLNRFMQPSFWRKLLTGQVGTITSMQEIFGSIRQVAANFIGRRPNKTEIGDDSSALDFIARMLHGFKCFEGNILLILSGQDATAREFNHLITTNSDWVKASTSSKVTYFRIPDANHTFSNASWRQQVAVRTADWLMTNQASHGVDKL